MTLTLQDALFSAALAVYLTASVFVAAVRWGHRCQPYGKHMDYYHPAWKTVIFCYLSNLLMAPARCMRLPCLSASWRFRPPCWP